MSLRPLWPLPLFLLLYWDAPRIVPYAVKIARGSILFTAVLVLPSLVYASLYGWPSWPEYTSRSVLSEHYHGPITVVLAGLGFAGIVFGFVMAGISFMVDAKRRPPK